MHFQKYGITAIEIVYCIFEENVIIQMVAKN